MENPQKKQTELSKTYHNLKTGLSKIYHNLKEWRKMQDEPGEYPWASKGGILFCFFVFAFIGAWLILVPMNPYLIKRFPILLGENKNFTGILAIVFSIFTIVIGVWFIEPKDDSGEWTWLSRILILTIFFGLAGVSAWLTLEFFAPFLICLYDLLKENKIFAGALALAIFVFVHGVGVWIIRTHDTKKQFRDSFRQQNETLFSNAVKLLFDVSNIARGVGLKELLQLRDPKNRERIGRITSSGLDLKQAQLHTADLQKADLQKADLREAKLQGADLQKADLQEADLREANLQGANLQRANLQKAKLWKTELQKTKLWKVNLQGAGLQLAKLYLAELQKTDLREAKLQGAKLQRANLQGANLQGAKLQEFQKADLKELQNAKLKELQEAELQEAELQRANLQSDELQKAELQKEELQKLQKEELQKLHKEEWQKLQEAAAEEKELRETNLLATNLKKANLQGANLKKANLQGANLQGTILTNIKWDKNTSFKNAKIDQKALDTTDEALKQKIMQEAIIINN